MEAHCSNHKVEATLLHQVDVKTSSLDEMCQADGSCLHTLLGGQSYPPLLPVAGLPCVLWVGVYSLAAAA